jgi:hypothetical protein
VLADRSLPEKGFGNPLPRHGDERDTREMTTTTHSAFGGTYADTEEKRKVPEIQPLNPTRKTSRGTGLKTAGATGERLKVGDTDAKEHTFVQRSWLYNRELSGHYNTDRPPRDNDNVPGSGLPGLGVQEPRPERPYYGLTNDTLKADVGIWSG